MHQIVPFNTTAFTIAVSNKNKKQKSPPSGFIVQEPFDSDHYFAKQNKIDFEIRIYDRRTSGQELQLNFTVNFCAIKKKGVLQSQGNKQGGLASFAKLNYATR